MGPRQPLPPNKWKSSDFIFTMSSTVTAPQIPQFLNMFHDDEPCGNSMTPSPRKNSDVQ
jgi:hypothetical protein